VAREVRLTKRAGRGSAPPTTRNEGETRARKCFGSPGEKGSPGLTKPAHRRKKVQKYIFIPRLYVETPVYDLKIEDAAKLLDILPEDLAWAIEGHGRCDSSAGTIIPATGE